MNINAAKYSFASEITVKATLIDENNELKNIENLLENTIKKQHCQKAKAA